MNAPGSKTYFEIDQLIGYELGEDWRNEFDDVYDAAEHWVSALPDEGRVRLVAEIDFIFDLESDAAGRLGHFPTAPFVSTDDSFDVWLRAVQQRAREALAGIHSNPLVDPEP